MPLHYKIMHNSLSTPSFLVWPCEKILLLKKTLLSGWSQFWNSSPSSLKDAEWVGWSHPSDMLSQLWEWEPLFNLHQSAIFFSNTFLPQLSPPLALILISFLLASFLLGLFKTSFTGSLSDQIEKELKNYFSFLPPTRYKNIFPF